MTFDSRNFLKHLTTHPGVYRMLNDAGEVLYVGKAKNLKARVSSYFSLSKDLSLKNQSLVKKIADVEVTVAGSETDALILEQNLIKGLKPPYNILLRDDKSYPYIFISSRADYPRLALHRGARRFKGRYFGPYPSAGAVRESLSLLQRIFKIRSCEESFFLNRSRPCLQYQIDRCSGSCVNAISKQQYAEDIGMAIRFLEGKSDELSREMVTKMERAASVMDYEEAALYRDKIAALRRVQEQQLVEGGDGDLDIIAAISSSGSLCVHVLFVRGGRVLGSKNYFPKSAVTLAEKEALEEFLPQFYLHGLGSKDRPKEIIIPHQSEGAGVLVEALIEQGAAKINVQWNCRGKKAAWQRLAVTNAEQALHSVLQGRSKVLEQFEMLQEQLGLEAVPLRIECFDISHTQGEETVASCVVFGQEGAIRSDYRRFNIKGIVGGDDYAAMEQALMRRYTRVKKGEGKIPDLVLIDGGKGQLGIAEKVFQELQIEGVQLIGVAKGPTRKPGFEMLIRSGDHQEIRCRNDSPALHLIQAVRDEAHRFAITGHRARRAKKRNKSSLEGIPGIGPKRRKEMLNFFGGLQEVQRAAIDEIAKVPGISRKLAEDIYAALHES